MVLPKPLQKLIEAFERLPGIGPKTAQRLTFYLLHVPQEELDRFADALSSLKRKTKICSICKNVDSQDPCSICQDQSRDHSQVCVVEEPLDVLALEKSGKYQGIYHVLHGRIDPLNNIGPDEIFIKELIKRILGELEGALPPPGEVTGLHPVREVILATNPDMEGEATAMYVAKKLRELKARFSTRQVGGEKTSDAVASNLKLKTLRITRLAYGLPIGADLEYADERTLAEALAGRKEY